MALLDYFMILTRRKWIVIATTLFTVLIVGISVSQSPVLYTAEATIRILTTRTGGTDYVDVDIQYAERLVSTYVSVATSEPVKEELSKYVNKIPKIRVEVVPSTELIKIYVEDEDRGLAQFTANKLAEILISRSRQLYSSDVNPVNITLAEPAILPKKPSSPSPFLLLGLGLAAGFLGGVGLAFLFENIDTRIYTTREIENITRLNVIGDIPDDKKKEDLNGIVEENIYIEAFRRLRTNIFTSVNNGHIKSLLITSAVKQDGRSFITANMALSIAHSSRSVVIVDANLRWPSQHIIFELDNEKGLSNVLKREVPITDVIRQTKYPRIQVITSGPKPNNPVELLDSVHMVKALNELAEQFDVILLDSPACLSVTDAVVLASKLDGVLMVVRHGWVREEALLTTINQLRGVGAKFLGVVSNRTESGIGSWSSAKSVSQVESQQFSNVNIANPHSFNEG